MLLIFLEELPRQLSGKEPACPGRRLRRDGFLSWVGKSPLEEETVTHSSILAWKIPWTEKSGRLYSPWGYKHDWGQSDMTELLSMHALN